MSDLPDGRNQQPLELHAIMTPVLSIYLRNPTLIVIIVFTLGGVSIAQQPTPPVQPTSASAFTPQERAQIVTQVLALPKVSVGMKDHRLTSLRVARESGDKEAPPQRLASVVLFDYTTGKATRFVIATETGALVREQPLRGRPQASEEELEEARKIIEANVEHKRLLQAGGVLEGGLIVDGPPGAPALHRFLQIQVLTADRHRIQRLVVVDLTTGTIVLSKEQPAPTPPQEAAICWQKLGA